MNGVTNPRGSYRTTTLRLKPFFVLPLFIVLTLLSPNSPIQLAHASTNWSSPILIDSHSGNSYLSSSLQGSNGTLWVAFRSDRNGQSTGRYDVIYKTYTNGIWSIDHNLTMMGQNTSPYLVQLANGTIAIFWSLKLAQSYQVYYSQYVSSGWSTALQITSTTLNDTQPSAALGADGTVWLVWTRTDSTNPNLPAVKQLYYKTWRNGVWSAEAQLTTDSNQNYGSAINIGKDGIVRVVWSKGSAGNTYQLYEKTYNRTLWSADSLLVSSSSTDEHPSLIQDRNGTLWLFWGRLIVVSLLLQYYEVWTQYSYNMGTMWSSQIQLTPTPGTTTFDSFQPSAVQSTYGVKPLWVFYTTNYNAPNYNIYALQSTGIGPVHDAAVTRIGSSSNLGTSWEYPGGLKSVGQSAIDTITVTIANTGDFVENLIVTASVTNSSVITVGTQSSMVGPGNTMNFYFYWNTTGVHPARYGVSVSIAALPGETLGNMGDNSYSITNQIRIVPVGDVNQDGNIDANDISVAIFDYGATPGSPRWNPYVDIKNSGFIDANDISFIIFHYGTFS